ncbi:hypothetical protein FSP39_003289 [Pinctada imbricata]|uniref:Myb/SANT-like DNA-binding domain-containing protein n=1 Tax=Pinctada imbricata TaxID=66713 RepID=A0AA89BKG9_PINIB|nr:hypothetical protein FSP39_003289 [Pinctada imbricata]
MKKKQVWGEISDVLRSKGFMFDADKCERKFLNLKTVYRNTVHHNSLVRNFDRKCSFFDELEDIFHLAEKSKEKLKSGGGDDKMDITLPGQRAVPIRMFHASERQSMLHINSGKMSPVFTGSPREVSSTTFPPYKPQTPTIQRQNLNTQLRQKFSNRTVSSSSRHQEMSPPATPTMAHQQHDGLQRRNSNSDVYNDSYGESPHGTAIIDLCRESSASGKRASSDVTSSTPSKRQRPNDLQNLLESFETYRREQREREDERMKIMKELHEDEMRVTNRFLDIIQQCVQTSKTE